MTEINLAVLSGRGITFTATGITLPNGLSFDQWAEIGDTLQRMEMAVQFAIGDWINYGEWAYGEQYTQAIRETGRAYQTLLNYAYVARSVKLAQRRDTLTFSHHAEIAKLEPDFQTRFLDHADKYRLSVSELRQDIKDTLTDKQPKAPAHTCPQCGFQFD